jgi:hypothetical protein
MSAGIRTTRYQNRLIPTMEVYPVRLEAPHVTLSDAELAQIEAELESWCLETTITLDNIKAELQKSLQEDDIDDGLKQLSGFKLLVKSITGIDCTRQDSLALVQEARNALVESNYLSVCQDNRHRTTSQNRKATHLRVLCRSQKRYKSKTSSHSTDMLYLQNLRRL